jgi:hypothetical protein
VSDTPEQSRKCSNCMWWVEHGPWVRWGEARGQCRAGPPITAPNSPTEDEHVHWPMTHATNWCGSFRMKEPGQ